jgi:uncharacterized membrane protein YdjX (TVP38/TMEM64 family)
MLLARPQLRILALVGCAGVLFALAALTLPHSPAALRAAVSDYGWAAPLAFIALWTAVTPALFSGTILALASGLLFGAAWGTAVGVAGSTLGAAASFALARRLGSGAFAQLSGRRVRHIRKVEERLAAHPFRALLILRLMPGMPVTWLNYAVGLTRIRLAPFVLASAIGAAPRVFIYAALGGSVGHASPVLRVLSLTLMALLALAGLAIAVRERRRAAPAPA